MIITKKQECNGGHFSIKLSKNLVVLRYTGTLLKEIRKSVFEYLIVHYQTLIIFCAPYVIFLIAI